MRNVLLVLLVVLVLLVASISMAAEGITLLTDATAAGAGTVITLPFPKTMKTFTCSITTVNSATAPTAVDIDIYASEKEDSLFDTVNPMAELNDCTSTELAKTNKCTRGIQTTPVRQLQAYVNSITGGATVKMSLVCLGEE